MYIKTDEKKNWAKKNFWTPSQKKQGPETKKTQKWPILDLKRAKYDRKNELF